VPKVNSPVDTSKFGGFISQPCSAVSADQLQALNLPVQGTADTTSDSAGAYGPSCIWLNQDTGSSADVSFLVADKKGLADIYLLKEQGRFPGYFQPTELDGYPAVFADLGDRRASGTCGLVVGLSDTFVFRAGVHDSKLGAKSCDRAKLVAAAVIKTVKGA
jgi:hypothetical protein